MLTSTLDGIEGNQNQLNKTYREKRQRSHSHLRWTCCRWSVLVMSWIWVTNPLKQAANAMKKHTLVYLFHCFLFMLGRIKAAVRSYLAFPFFANQNPPVLASVSGFNFKQIYFIENWLGAKSKHMNHKSNKLVFQNIQYMKIAGVYTRSCSLFLITGEIAVWASNVSFKIKSNKIVSTLAFFQVLEGCELQLEAYQKEKNNSKREKCFFSWNPSRSLPIRM